MERLKLFLPLIIFVILAAVFFGVQRDTKTGDYSPTALPSALVGKPLPAFSLTELNSGEVLQRDDLLGSWFLLNVWATWCPSCHFEHPFLVELAQQGVRIYSVDYKDSAPEAREWLEEKGNPYLATLFDPDGTLGLDLGVTGAPETYVVDAQGVIRFRYQGALDAKIWQREFGPIIADLEAGQ